MWTMLEWEQQNMLLLLLFSWPPVRDMCPNYEVVMFEPWKGTPPYLGSVNNFYVAMLLSPAPPFPPFHPMFSRGAYPLMPLPYLPFWPYSTHTVSLAQPGVTFLRPSILRSITPWIRISYVPTFPALATPSGFPTPKLCRCQNLF